MKKTTTGGFTSAPNTHSYTCGHLHRTPHAAQACIDKTNRAIARRPGSRGAHCGMTVHRAIRDEGGAVRAIAAVGDPNYC